MFFASALPFLVSPRFIITYKAMRLFNTGVVLHPHALTVFHHQWLACQYSSKAVNGVGNIHAHALNVKISRVIVGVG